MLTKAVVLAAGNGKRMNSDTKKQYIKIHDKPLLYYSLQVFEQSIIDEVILVTSKEDISFCREEIVDKYHFTKISKIVAGGKERYHSVAAGLAAAGTCDYVFIHDGARPFLTQDILNRAFDSVITDRACVVGMPVKDTIKIASEDNCVSSTPNRSKVWMIQTPQVFDCSLIQEAYQSLLQQEEQLLHEGVHITDDAMVVEQFTGQKIKLIQGSYSNIKITTPEDLQYAEMLLMGHNHEIYG